MSETEPNTLEEAVQGCGNDQEVKSLLDSWARQKAKTQRYVGLEDNLEKLMNRIITEEADSEKSITTEESDTLEIIPLVGDPGIGKTTLAKRVFRDPRIAYEFPILTWVDASREVDMRSVCLTILKSFTSRDKFRELSDDDLLQMVPKYLRMIKFFMVIDDVWSIEEWEKIRQVIPMENRKSIVLMITRYLPVALSSSIANGKDRHLRLLRDDESWDLLKLEVFGDVNACPVELDEVGKAIALLCGGLPLSIVVVGGILRNKMSRKVSETSTLKKEWDDIRHSFINRPKYGGIGISGDIMSWSYSSLPDYLKDCFLYLGLLPEDTEIPVWKLTRLWIAEGLIREKQGQSLEETARDSLMELINMNLLMACKINISDQVKTCRVHAMIREFCKEEVSARKRNLFEIITLQPGTTSSEGTSESSSQKLHPYRHFCIHSNVNKFLYEHSEVPQAHSFLCFPKSPVKIENEDVALFINAFTAVRVLEANSIKFPRFPAKLTQLIQLRYITLSCDELMILPEAISDLWSLQTLFVYTLSPTLEVEADISKLMHLRCLKTKASMSLVKWEGIGCGNLHTLAQLSPKSFTHDVPNKARNLKELGIRGTLSQSMSFEELDSLEKLKLQHVVSECSLAGLPEEKRFPPNLKFLVLSATFLDWKHISVLAKLVTLKVLKLKDNAFTGDFWEVSDGGFRRLEALSIAQADLKYWSVSSDSFPKLRNLELKNCEKLLEVPLELGETLEKLLMSHVTKYAVSCAEMIQKEKAKKGTVFTLEIHHGDM